MQHQAESESARSVQENQQSQINEPHSIITKSNSQEILASFSLQEKGVASESSDKANPALDVFTDFQKLPPELRNKIIEANLEGRCIDVFQRLSCPEDPDQEDDSPEAMSIRIEEEVSLYRPWDREPEVPMSLEINFNGSNPLACLHVNQEFRAVVFKFYELVEPDDESAPFYMDYKKDVVQVRSQCFDELRFKDVFRDVERLLLPWSYFSPSECCHFRRELDADFITSVVDTLKSFRYLRELYIQQPLPKAREPNLLERLGASPRTKCSTPKLKVGQEVLVDISGYPYKAEELIKQEKMMMEAVENAKKENPRFKDVTIKFVEWAINSPIPEFPTMDDSDDESDSYYSDDDLEDEWNGQDDDESDFYLGNVKQVDGYLYKMENMQRKPLMRKGLL